MIERQDDEKRLELTMKKTAIKAISVTALALLLLAPLSAYDAMSVVTYNISFPFDHTKDFSLDSESFRGAAYEFRSFIQPNVSVGLYGAWHVFNGTTTKTIVIEDDEFSGAITGKQFRYINAFPAMANMHYYLGSQGGIQAFLGLNAGMMIIEERVELGVVAAEKTRVHIGLAPEFGFKIPMGYNSGILASVKYHYAFKATGLSGEPKSQTYLSLNVGFTFDHGLF